MSFEGIVTVFAYDALCRLVTKTFFDNQANFNNGIVAETWAYEYDAFGRVSKISVQEPGTVSPVRETVTEYDSQGRTTSITTPEGTVSYEYDKFGRQIRVSSDKGDNTSYTYDDFGRLATVTARSQTTRYTGGVLDFSFFLEEMKMVGEESF